MRAALKDVWEIFDRPCGQRLAPLLRTEVDRLRRFGELLVPDEVAEKLRRISPATMLGKNLKFYQIWLFK